MIFKGFIFYRSGKIPFVVQDYCMELFTDDALLNNFCKEYSRKNNFLLHGECFDNGCFKRNSIFLIEKSSGSTLYLRCYIIYINDMYCTYDGIGFQSPPLDEVFGYGYERIDRVRDGINLDLEQISIYQIPFEMNGRTYDLQYKIGYNNNMGLLEDLNRKGEIVIPLWTNEVTECYDIATVLHRLSIFLLFSSEVAFKKITLYNKDIRVGWFYCSLISEEPSYLNKGFFYEFDVMKYVPSILKNIALDAGNKITHSVPLGHIMGRECLFSPQRFMEQLMSFEYLFDKLDHKRAKDKNVYLQNELEEMFSLFSQLLSKTNYTAEKISEDIKELRRTITHGYAYYYDFKNDLYKEHIMLILDKLLACMSLKYIGFSLEEIMNYSILLQD